MIIDEIFHKRAQKLERERKAEEEKKAREDAEHQEVLDANKSLKDSLAGRSAGSKITLMQQMSVDPTGMLMQDDKSSVAAPPVDTTKEFLNTIND